jgi:hypothetical protein
MRTPLSGRLLERPVDGAAADPQRPGDLGHSDVSGLIPRPGQRDLGRGELGGTAARAAAGPRGSPAHRRPLEDQLPLELGRRGEDVEDQPAGAVSAKIFWQPAAASASVCPSRFCDAPEIRA